MSRSAALLVGLALGLVAPFARAHDFDPGVLAIVEEPPGGAVTHRYKLTQPTDTRAPDASVRVRFPSSCTVDERARSLSCRPPGLDGELSFEGLERGTSRARMIVTYERRGGAHTELVVDGDGPFSLHLADPRSARGASAWARLGARHLLTGPDHVAFLVALMCLVTKVRALAVAITAFSVGHAASLGLAASGWVVVPAAPVEALIALSVVVVAREAMLRHRLVASPLTLLVQAPFVASLGFGLIHGTGFASSLGEAGFPRDALAPSLAAFHVGIELAQLAIVGVLALSWSALRALAPARAPLARNAALYTVGVAGAWWTLARTSDVLFR